MLQSPARMNMLLLKGVDLFIPVIDQGFQVSTALTEACVAGQLSLKRGLGGCKFSALGLYRGLLSGRVTLSGSQLRSELDELIFQRGPLHVKSRGRLGDYFLALLHKLIQQRLHHAVEHVAHTCP
ncbi:hypothetical protein D9M71_716690 [compost metagenome]